MENLFITAQRQNKIRSGSTTSQLLTLEVVLIGNKSLVGDNNEEIRLRRFAHVRTGVDVCIYEVVAYSTLALGK